MYPLLCSGLGVEGLGAAGWNVVPGWAQVTVGHPLWLRETVQLLIRGAVPTSGLWAVSAHRGWNLTKVLPRLR